MKETKHREEKKPVTFRILTAIAKDVIRNDYTISASEWKARIKDRLVLQGFTYPSTEMLPRAMNAVEHALTKQDIQIGPTLNKQAPTPAETQQDPPQLGIRRGSDWTSLRDLISLLTKHAPS